MRHHVRAQQVHGRGGRPQHPEFLLRQLGELRARAEQRPVVRELAQQQLHARVLVERRVVLAHAGLREQFGEHLLVRFRVLPHVQGLQVESERAHRPPQVTQSRRPKHLGPALTESRVDDLQIGEHLTGGGVRLGGGDLVVVTAAVSPRPGRRRGGPPRGEAASDHSHGAAEGHVLPRGAELALLLPEGVREVAQLGGHAHDTPRQGQFALEHPQLVGVVLVQQRGGLFGGESDDVAGDVRIAVTVAADPGAGADDGPVSAAQALGDLGVERRDHVHERGLVILQAAQDLVLDAGALAADDRGLPQGEHLAADVGLDLGELGVGDAVLWPGPQRVAAAHEVEHAAGDLEDRPAARLGGVCGEDGNHPGGGPDSLEFVGVRLGLREASPGGLEIPVGRRRTGGRVDAATPLLVEVLGHVGQKRE